MSKTAEQAQAAQQPQSQPSRGEVAVIAPPRLPYHPLIEDRFGVDRATWRALTDAVFPSARSTDAVLLALSYCKARNLDPFKRVVHIVPVWNKEKRAFDETVWPGIAEHRTTAFRTKQYAGAEACTFGPAVEKEFAGETKNGALKITVRFPDWAQITVYRLIDGQRVAMPGPRVYWLETYSRMGRTEVPNEMWQKRPFGQLEKCAEAAALRRAFPEELGGEATADEVGAHQFAGDDTKDVTPPRPRRGDFDEATGEVLEPISEAAERAADRRMERERAGEPPEEPEAENDADQAEPSAAPVRAENPFAISAPNGEAFCEEFRRRLNETVVSPTDVDHLLNANTRWFNELSKQTRSVMLKEANLRRDALAK